MLNELNASIYCSSQGFVYQHGDENGWKLMGYTEGRKLGRKPKVSVLTAEHFLKQSMENKLYVRLCLKPVRSHHACVYRVYGISA